MDIFPVHVAYMFPSSIFFTLKSPCIMKTKWRRVLVLPAYLLKMNYAYEIICQKHEVRI